MHRSQHPAQTRPILRTGRKKRDTTTAGIDYTIFSKKCQYMEQKEFFYIFGKNIHAFGRMAYRVSSPVNGQEITGELLCRKRLVRAGHQPNGFHRALQRAVIQDDLQSAARRGGLQRAVQKALKSAKSPLFYTPLPARGGRWRPHARRRPSARRPDTPYRPATAYTPPARGAARR